jgi:uncharacterized secreted protein with C-terminal beta-propeller domain
MGSRLVLRRKLRKTRARRLQHETLEPRWVLDSATLVPDVFNLQENGPQATLNVLANDVFTPDYTGQKLITSVSFGSEGGRIEIAADRQSILYTAPADFFGTESFVYAVDGQYTAQVQVSVQSPLAFDQYTIPPDGQVHTLEVLANDPFWPGYVGARDITAVSVGSSGGTIVIASDRKSIRYTPPDGAFGRETFIYVVDDIYPAQVTIDIPQTLKHDEYEFVQHDPPATLAVLANDPFWPGYPGEKKITHVTASQVGATITISLDGRSVVYTQPADFGQQGSYGNVYDSFRYVVDGTYETNVTVVLHRPVRDDWFEVDQNSTGFFFNVTANDYYYDLSNHVHDVIDRVTSVTQSEQGGIVAISPDGQGILYSPPAGFSGADTFTYTADGKHRASVSVQVTRPVRDDHISTGIYQDTPGGTLNVLSNDFLGNGYAGPKVITAVGATQHGGIVTIRSDGKALLYTPAADFTGLDTFTYTVDGTLQANVSVVVQALAQHDSYSFLPEPSLRPYTLHVLSNDHFNKGYAGPGVITAAEIVSGSGTVTIQNGSALVFNPASADSHTIRYTVDGKYETTVSVWIRNVVYGDEFVVDQNSPATQLNVLVNDFYIQYIHNAPYYYGGPRIITGISESEHGGVVTITANGRSVNYQPAADFYGRDSFTYTVDGFMTATVSVEVIRRVRDDVFRVDAADGTQALPVLANDLFGANYSGPGQITAVTPTAAGGTAAIGTGGHAIVYTPKAGFVGTDTFTYTVDGVLKAEVTVFVDAPATDQTGTFDSVDDYTQFLLDDALERYEYLFGQPAWPFLGPPEGPIFLSPDASNGPGLRNHSETNVQVAGVDEGDIMEFDADYIYTLNSSEVVIVDAWPADELSVESRVPIEGRPLVEFLHGDRLTVISETGGYIGFPIDFGLPFADVGRPFGPDIIFPFPPFEFMPFSTIVTVIDVSDRAAPTIVQTTTMEGKYVDSRGVGDFVYVLVSNANAVAEPPQVIDEDNDPMTPGRYETQEEFIARVTANAGLFVEGALPNYSSYGPDGEVVRTGLLNMPEDVYEPLVPDAFNLISVVSFDVEGDEPGLADSAAAYSTGASAIYASLDNFYVFDRDYSSEDGAITRIVKFDWEPDTGGIEFAATTAVAGTILNQFSADENGDYLRIATTVSNNHSGNWSGRDENMLFVLQEDDGVFEFVGSLQNLALNETMRSVRFLGDRVFVTTFRDVDPLFAIDLSDPANPTAVGHITLPGFTSYMHLVDENYLLTVGKNTPVGHSGPTQVSLFDITNLEQPRRIAEYTFERFSTSEAELDHHAFGYYAEHGLLGMPLARVFFERVDEDGDGYRETRRAVTENLLAVFSVDTAAANPSERLVLSGEIEHDTPVRRSGYIGDKLYSIASDSVKAVDVTALNDVIAEVSILPLPEEEEENPPPPPTPVIPGQYLLSADQRLEVFPAVRNDSLLMTVTDRARSDLAARLEVGEGAPMLVSAEASPEAPGGGYQLVFRMGDDHYLYRAGTNGNVQLIDDSYEFTGEAWHAVGSFVVAPPAGLPGDYNNDNRVDDQDRQVWRANFGAWSLTSYPTADGNRDGNVDAADDALWRKYRGAVALTALAGDFDASGAVDDADYNVWRTTFGSTTDFRADANRDHQIDAADYSIWRRARTAAAQGQAVDQLLLTGAGLSNSPALTGGLSPGDGASLFVPDESDPGAYADAIDAALELISAGDDSP